MSDYDNVCTVRLTTTYWYGKSGVHMKKSLTYLKRKSKGYNIIKEDSIAIGVSDLIGNIVNLNECQDGVYICIPTNLSFERESGLVDDYDYMLIPFKGKI